MKSSCPRTLDKPMLFFGLELEEVAVLTTVAGMGSLVFVPFIPGVISIIAGVAMIRFKAGKPPGYLLHWFYAQGISFPGLIPPPKKIGQYAVRANTY